MAGIIAVKVATYLFENNLFLNVPASSHIINLWIRVAVSKVVAAKEITSTAIIVFAIVSGNPNCCNKAPPPKTNATALLLSGNGHIDLRPSGNEIPNNAGTPTGDVLLSTKNFADGDNYTIIVEFR